MGGVSETRKATSADDDKIAWYENVGKEDPRFASHVITTKADSANSVYAADLDVLSSSMRDDKIAWYENRGGFLHPTFKTHVITTDAESATSVYAADLDGDGDLDVLSASSKDQKIAWYENNWK